MIGNSNDQTNFPDKSLLTDRCVTSLHEVFANNSAACAAPASADIKLSKTQLSKKVQSSGFLGRLLGPLLKTDLPLMKSVLQPLAKSVLMPLGLTASA